MTALASTPPAVPLSDDAFKQQLAAVIPHLRAFGRSLAGDPDTADDLVQDTMLKAWTARASFAAGSSIKAWTFVILRNAYFSRLRRQKFQGDYDEGVAERTLTVAAAQEDGLRITDLQRALLQLPAEQREALILVGAGGMPYEEAAAVCGCAVGTMKSRVSRGRTALAALLDSGQLSILRQDMPSGTVGVDRIMDSVDDVVNSAAGKNGMAPDQGAKQWTSQQL